MYKFVNRLRPGGGLRAARYAVESGAFPLYEVEDGRRYTLNQQRTARPLSDYLALQLEVDEGWARLARQIEMNAAGEVERA
jgi:pyruvate/2-oxoacid:ferredoxin oxidoreductase beta subunit